MSYESEGTMPRLRPSPVPLSPNLGDGYEVRRAVRADGPRVRAVLQSSLGSDQRWLHDQAHNPLGLGMQLAFWQGELVGFLAITLLPGSALGKEIRLARIDGSWVHPNHRHGIGGGGLVTRLARAAHSNLQNGATWFVREGDGQEVPGLRPLGLRPCGPLWTARAAVGDWAGGHSLQAVHSFPMRPEAWMSGAMGHGLSARPFGVMPSQATLAWRAQSASAAQHIGLRVGERPSAWLLCAPSPKSPRDLWIADWWVSDNQVDAARALLCGAATVARDLGAEQVLMTFPQRSRWFDRATDLGLVLMPSGRWCEWAWPGSVQDTEPAGLGALWMQPLDWGWL